jgi:ankyrin repeat protein
MKKVMLLIGLVVVSANAKGMIDVSLDNIANRTNNLRLMNAKDRLGNTLLMIAAINDSESRLRHLLRMGAKIDETNNDGDTALSLALQYGCTNAAKILLENKANPNLENNKKQTPLMFASYQGYNGIVEQLISCGADVNAEDEDKTTSLMLASEQNNDAIVSHLINHGAKINAKDKDDLTSLMFASYQGYDSIVKILINNGADVKIKDNQGRTAKYFALSNRHKKVAKLLRAESRKIEEFWEAVYLRDLQSIQNLADKNKFLINEIDSFGNNALLLALCYKDKNTAKWLLEQKIHLNISNNEGDTPLLAAIRYAFDVILSFQVDIPDMICETEKDAEDLLSETGMKEVLKAYSLCRGVFDALIEKRLDDVKFLLDCFEIRESLTTYLPSVYALLKIFHQAMINEIFVEPAIRAALQIDPHKITYQVNKLLNPDLTYKEYKNLN